MDDNVFGVECCGCSTCVDVCPKQALSMITDKNGFWRVRIDNNKCINCKMCNMICPEMSRNKDGVQYRKAYLFKTSSKQQYFESSSGAANAELVKYFIDRGAIVYGVGYDNHMRVICFSTQTQSEANRFKGSKYVQSKFDHISSQIENDLNKGKQVFITSTPCVIAGIKNYVRLKKIDDSQLYTCDFMCHGVGSPKIWNDYIHYLRNGSDDVVDFRFREKTNDINSHTHHSKIIYRSGKILFDRLKCKIFQNLYFKNLVMNESCYSCYYASSKRYADITLADNSGYKPKKEDSIDFRHSSLALVNTEKGIKLLKVLNEIGFIKEISIEEVVQPHLKNSNEKPDNYQVFWEKYNKSGFAKIARSYGGNNIISYIHMKKSGII